MKGKSPAASIKIIFVPESAPTPMSRILWAAFAAILLAAPQAAPAQGTSGLKVIDRIAGPDGGWDYTSFDPARRRIYVAHGTSIFAIDVDSGKVIPDFAAGNHLHAVVPVPGLDRLVTTNSGDQTVKILSAVDGKLIASIPVAADPDSAIYDPHTGTVVVIGGDSGTVTLIDPKTAAKVAEVKVGGDLEFADVDGKGRVWINAADTHEIVVMDLDSRKVVGRYPLSGCLRPTGLAYVAGGRLVSSCQSSAKILDAATGRDIATLPIGVGPDAVIYDAGRGVAYIPSGRAGNSRGDLAQGRRRQHRRGYCADQDRRADRSGGPEDRADLSAGGRLPARGRRSAAQHEAGQLPGAGARALNSLREANSSLRRH